MNFIGAFLNSDLKEDIYMEILPELIKLTAKDQKFTNLAIKYGYCDGSHVGDHMLVMWQVTCWSRDRSRGRAWLGMYI